MSIRFPGLRRWASLALAALLATTSAAWLAPAPAAAAVTITISNSDSAGHQLSRFDVDGNALDAHDGSLIQYAGTYYLYGTSYACGYKYQINSTFCGFKVYSSPDLVHWTDRGHAVPAGTCGYCFRAQVKYNAATGTFVLWSDAGIGNSYAVYTSPTPTGPFTRRPNPTLAVGGAIDMSLFVDDDGTGYLIHNTVQVAAGLTADMVVEQLTPDYLGTTGANVRLGLGDVEGFAVFKRNGVYHALMSEPSCAYCSGGTGEMTATSMLGPWSGAWYDPNGVHQSGRAEPRWRARLVNADNCGGQPLAVLPVAQQNGTTGYYFVSDRWNNRAPNESLANFFIGPMSFTGDILNTIDCVSSFTASLATGTAGTYNSLPQLNQGSGFDGFRHYCDITSAVERQQSFTPSASGVLTGASVTTFQSGDPNAPLFLDIVDAANGTVLGTQPVTTTWAPSTAKTTPGVRVDAGHAYQLRLRTAATVGCYGFEYNDGDPYPGGAESYRVTSGSTFTAEPARDLKFTVDVSPFAIGAELPGGYTRCAGEGQACTFTGTRVVAYGAGGYAYKLVSSPVTCGAAAFGGDPAYGVTKSCYVAPAGGPSGYTLCAAENGTCSTGDIRMVAYGVNGAFVYRLANGSVACGNGAFGDPAYGVAKSCYSAPVGGPGSGWTSCAGEGGNCSAAAGQVVAYGANGAFTVATTTGGSTTCGPAAFSDPIYGVAKSCYLRTGAPSGYATSCAAAESGTCAFTGVRTVAYGAAGRFVYRSFTGGTPCAITVFGTDPIYGVAKNCYLTP
ncbi:hypothetical protein F4553_001212 [Allocatelliglobosispora scoriae]|uniref:Beta-xylosidase n=1 Tax=Allocatelliglobosispora scoriae TaxID=643052 RepID=A0A841BLH7_9ACTN|nr:family 43 glycosylhydrolase [Allocatelliglobosispora scoriae]MBB5867833.1 hypothetical protein [Allocatelliglobosispora scoriae]